MQSFENRSQHKIKMEYSRESIIIGTQCFILEKCNKIHKQWVARNETGWTCLQISRFVLTKPCAMLSLNHKKIISFRNSWQILGNHVMTITESFSVLEETEIANIARLLDYQQIVPKAYHHSMRLRIIRANTVNTCRPPTRYWPSWYVVLVLDTVLVWSVSSLWTFIYLFNNNNHVCQSLPIMDMVRLTIYSWFLWILKYFLFFLVVHYRQKRPSIMSHTAFTWKI